VKGEKIGPLDTCIPLLVFGNRTMANFDPCLTKCVI